MGIKPGDKVAIKIDGKLYTDVITSIRYEWPTWQPAPPPRPWWGRLLRRLRLVSPDPVPVPRPGQIKVGLAGDATEKQVSDLQRAVKIRQGLVDALDALGLLHDEQFGGKA
jgi:hypothetical protein